MGAGASSGVSAATKAASPAEIENALGTFTRAERGKLHSALSKRDGPDAVFGKAGGADGDVDVAEWAETEDERLLLVGGEKAPLQRLLAVFDKDKSGLVDAEEVSNAIKLYNALDKRGILMNTTDDDHIQLPKAKDGKVSCRAVELVLCLHAEGPPQRPIEQMVAVFAELHLAKCLFTNWAAGQDLLQVERVNEACAILARWVSSRAKATESVRIPLRYHDWLPQPNLYNFTKWLWEELAALEDSCALPFVQGIVRLREARKIVECCARTEWTEMQSIEPTLLGPILAAYEGMEWNTLWPEERREFESRAAAQLGLNATSDGRVLSQDLNSWVQEKVISLPAQRIAPVIARVQEFLPAAYREESTYRILCSFKKWDLPSRGRIAPQDLCTVMGKLGVFTQEELDALLSGAGTDPDGKVDYSEFTRWVMAAPAEVA